jgi:hypothetical protein
MGPRVPPQQVGMAGEPYEHVARLSGIAVVARRVVLRNCRKQRLKRAGPVWWSDNVLVGCLFLPFWVSDCRWLIAIAGEFVCAPFSQIGSRVERSQPIAPWCMPLAAAAPLETCLALKTPSLCPFLLLHHFSNIHYLTLHCTVKVAESDLTLARFLLESRSTVKVRTAWVSMARVSLGWLCASFPCEGSGHRMAGKLAARWRCGWLWRCKIDCLCIQPPDMPCSRLLCDRRQRLAIASSAVEARRCPFLRTQDACW